jgi:hypothetical protein
VELAARVELAAEWVALVVALVVALEVPRPVVVVMGVEAPAESAVKPAKAVQPVK